MTAPRAILIANSIESSGVCIIRFKTPATQSESFFRDRETANIFSPPLSTAKSQNVRVGKWAARKPAAPESLLSRVSAITDARPAREVAQAGRYGAALSDRLLRSFPLQSGSSRSAPEHRAGAAISL